MKPEIEIIDHNLEEVAKLLNLLLADEYVLYTKTHNSYMNVNGPGFYELHKFFEGQYETLDIIITDIAECVRTIGHFALRSAKDQLRVTQMSGKNPDFSNSEDIIQSLVNEHEKIIRIIRNDIVPVSDKYKDIGIADFVTGLMEQHEKMSWTLRSSISHLNLISEIA